MRQSSFLLAVVLATSFLSSAQTAEEIVAKALQARGGADKLKAIKSLKITGAVVTEAESTSFVFVQLQKRPNKLRRDLSIQGMTLSRGFDGQQGWEKTPVQASSESAVNVLTGQELEDLRTEADFDGILMDYKQKGYKVELSGKETAVGKDAYRLKVTMKDGVVRNIFIDAASFLEVKVAGTTQREGVTTDFELILSDYRNVAGIMFPFSFEDRQPSGGAANQKLVLQKVEFNIAIDDSTFAVPAAAASAAPK